MLCTALSGAGFIGYQIDDEVNEEVNKGMNDGGNDGKLEKDYELTKERVRMRKTVTMSHKQ